MVKLFCYFHKQWISNFLSWNFLFGLSYFTYDVYKIVLVCLNVCACVCIYILHTCVLSCVRPMSYMDENGCGEERNQAVWIEWSCIIKQT